MLSPDQVKPFLTHADEDVRALAADFFSDCWSRDPEILPLTLDARDRFGDELYLRNLSRAKHFVITESTFDRLVTELEKATAERVIERLGELIANAPADLLRARRDLIAKHPKLSPAILRTIELRLDYLDWTGERLWNELQALARKQNEIGEDESDDEEEEFDDETGDSGDVEGIEDLSEELIDALATRDVPDSETIRKLLADPETKDTWLEIYLVSLAGKRGLREAIPNLIEKFHAEEADFLIEATAEALARIGDIATIGPLVEAYEEGDWSFKFSVTNVLGDLKHPESEAAILKLLKSESDSGIRTMLCVSLCELISEHAVETVRKEIASGSKEAFQETAPLALSVAEILGQELPKVAVQWQREKKRQHEALKEAEREWDNEEEPFSTDEDDLDFEPGDDAGPNPNLGVAPVRPIRNEGPRVGRNDPCPCGSGRKYKKCCGASR